LSYRGPYFALPYRQSFAGQAEVFSRATCPPKPNLWLGEGGSYRGRCWISNVKIQITNDWL